MCIAKTVVGGVNLSLTVHVTAILELLKQKAFECNIAVESGHFTSSCT